MQNIKELLGGAKTGTRGKLLAVGEIMIYVAVLALAIGAIGSQREHIWGLAKAHPVFTALVTALMCFLALVIMAWRANDPRSWRNNRDVVFTVLVTVVGLGLGYLLISAASTYAAETLRMGAVRAATGWALAYFAGGFLSGFLFGFPRVNQGRDSKNNGKSPGGEAGAESPGYEQRVNNNLVEISDWLTKIIVGLGLVELRAMPARIRSAAEWMAQSIVGSAPGTDLGAAASFCCAFILFFSVIGFLSGYLLTRLYFSGAFSRADQGGNTRTETDAGWATAGDSTTGAPGAAAAAPSPDADRIRAYWKPAGQIDSKADAALKGWLKSKNIDASVPLFIAGGQYADMRALAVKELGLE